MITEPSPDQTLKKNVYFTKRKHLISLETHLCILKQTTLEHHYIGTNENFYFIVFSDSIINSKYISC